MRYKVFGRHTGLRVSELVLGTGVFGTRWGHGSDPDEARRILDAYAEAGGNFIDTADSYQFGESEELLGQFLQGRRDDFVLATKFTQGATPDAGILVTGNSRKAMVASLEASLRRLQDRPHRPLLGALRRRRDAGRGDRARLRRPGAGRQDPLCGALRLPGLAGRAGGDHRGAARLAPIAGLQVEHSLVERTTEQDLLPMGQALGLGIVAWSPLGGGMLTGKYRRGETGRAEGLGGRVFQPENSPQRTAILDTVIAVAEETGATPGQVAIAWVASKGPLPIIGPRTLEQLDDNLGAAQLELAAEQIARLDEASAIPPVFPYTVIDHREYRQRATGGKLDQLDLPTVPVA